MPQQTDGEAHGSQLPSVQLEKLGKETLSKINTEEGILAQLRGFVRGDAQLKELYLQRLRAIHSTLSACRPFSEHQFINSSLLFVHDVRVRARASTTTGRRLPSPLSPPSLSPLGPPHARFAARAGRAAALWRVDDRLQQGAACEGSPDTHGRVAARQPGGRLPLRAHEHDSHLGGYFGGRGLVSLALFIFTVRIDRSLSLSIYLSLISLQFDR